MKHTHTVSNNTPAHHRDQTPQPAETIITRTAPGGKTYEVIINDCDLALYSSRRWQRHQNGLRNGTGNFLHRLIAGASPGQFVLWRSGNKYDVRRANLKVVSAEEQRTMEKRPYIRTSKNGRPSGVHFVEKAYLYRGRKYAYRAVHSSFCFRGKNHSKSINYGKIGLPEATRRVLQWRVNMIREHGIEPNRELLDMLERTTRMARAGCSFEEIYGGNVEYENSVVVGSESSFQVIGFDYGRAA